MKKSEITLKKMLELPERIAIEVTAIAVVSGILAGALAQLFDVEYWVDMVFWTWAGVAFAGLMLDLVVFAVIGIIFMFTVKEDD